MISTNLVGSYNYDNRVVCVNREFTRFFGYTPEETCFNTRRRDCVLYDLR
jgi:hypothetical protein